jgi:hypothetical protein
LPHSQHLKQNSCQWRSLYDKSWKKKYKILKYMLLYC